MNSRKTKPTIGFIGQGWIGKNYADDFEARGYSVVRYAKEEPYTKNKDAIKTCDIVFIAVPTPTNEKGFDDSIVRGVVTLIGKGKSAVIKSTLLPGTTTALEQAYPDRYIFHSPEFLSVSTALHDAQFPERNIVGMAIDNAEYRQKAQEVLETMAPAPYNKICTALEAELIKYGRNTLGFVRVLMVNLLYDLAVKLGADWGAIEEAMSNDPLNGPRYMRVVHQGGRGAGGACFIKDFEAFSRMYKDKVGDPKGIEMLQGLIDKNIELLVKSHKDLELLRGVYGNKISEVL
jgi:nucleotide sugar dehydrogenase